MLAGPEGMYAYTAHRCVALPPHLFFWDERRCTADATAEMGDSTGGVLPPPYMYDCAEARETLSRCFSGGTFPFMQPGGTSPCAAQQNPCACPGCKVVAHDGRQHDALEQGLTDLVRHDCDRTLMIAIMVIKIRLARHNAQARATRMVKLWADLFADCDSTHDIMGYEESPMSAEEDEKTSEDKSEETDEDEVSTETDEEDEERPVLIATIIPSPVKRAVATLSHSPDERAAKRRRIGDNIHDIMGYERES
eukprot:g5765.t1